MEKGGKKEETPDQFCPWMVQRACKVHTKKPRNPPKQVLLIPTQLHQTPSR